MLRPTLVSPLLILSFLSFFISSTHAIKFNLQAYRFPPAKCIWNAVHTNTLVVVTANVGPGPRQRVDIEIIDSSPQKNVYLSKKNINSETRLAVTTHAEGEVGVCFRNFLDHGTFITIAFARLLTSVSDAQNDNTITKNRVIDLEVDIGADAVDYKYVALRLTCIHY